METSRMTIQESADDLALPNTRLAAETARFVATHEPPAIANHSIRSYLFARILARRRGMRPGQDFDDDLLFLACALHDIGLTAIADKEQRFEVDGADAAAEFLAGKGLSSSDVDAVWQAIALHTSGGIAERRGPLCQLTRGGVALDISADGGIVDDDAARAIHSRYPRLSMARELVDAIVAQVRAKPAKAPAYSLPAELARERHDLGVTGVERAARPGRWGE
jgi:hypothetical protein